MALKLKYFALLPLSLLLLSGCGGGSGSSDTKDATESNVSGNNSTDSAISGLVIDGYIQGATVCLDINNNYACDDDEPSALSGPGGAYSFTYSESIPAGTQILADVPVGAVDEDLGVVEKPYNMLAPADHPEVVTPLTTLVSQEIISSGKTLSSEEAEKSVKIALGIDTNKDLLANDFVAEADASLQSSATALAEALAVTKEALESASAADDLTPQEITKAAIKTIKDVVATELIVNGVPTMDVDAVAGSVGTVVSGQVQNIVAASKSGDGEAVSLITEIQEGKLIILSEGEERLEENGQGVWREGLIMEFVYFPEAIEDTIMDITSASEDKVAMLVYDGPSADTWVPLQFGEDYVLDTDGSWAKPSDIENSGTKIVDNCAIFYDNGTEASNEFCFVRKDISGKPLSDIVQDICTDDGVVMPGCDPDAEIPEGSYVYDATMTTPENAYGGVYQVYAHTDGWLGYVSSSGEQTIQGFISEYLSQNRVGYRGESCNTAFRVKSYDAQTKSGVFEWTDSSSANGCNGFSWTESAVVETSAFDVVEIGEKELIKSKTPMVLRGNNPDETAPYLIFAETPNGQGQNGIYSGDFNVSGTKISRPFTGDLDFGVFASKIFVDFVFEQSSIPAFPYDRFIAD